MTTQISNPSNPPLDGVTITTNVNGQLTTAEPGVLATRQTFSVSVPATGVATLVGSVTLTGDKTIPQKFLMIVRGRCSFGSSRANTTIELRFYDGATEYSLGGIGYGTTTGIQFTNESVVIPSVPAGTWTTGQGATTVVAQSISAGNMPANLSTIQTLRFYASHTGAGAATVVFEQIAVEIRVIP